MLVVIAIVFGSVVYAELNGIPFRRVILAIALTCASWAIVSIYLRFLFDNSSLGRTASKLISYIIASFLAFLYGNLVYELVLARSDSGREVSVLTTTGRLLPETC